MLSTFCGFSQTVIQAEYFWDADPGEGNGITLQAFDGNFNQALESVFNNNATLPSVGNHIIGIRIKGQEGNWSSVFRKTFKVSANNNSNNLVKITQAEYFWDNDPGQGSGNTMLVFDGNFNQALESVLANNATLPSVGDHVIGIRVKGDEGIWGTTYRKVFRVSQNNNSNTLVKVTTSEYFWDSDPGEGNGNIMLAFDGNFNQALESIISNNATLPSVGDHTIGIRVKADDGNWGTTYRKVFRLSNNNNSNNLVKITQAEYFWNADPGQGNGSTMLAFDGNFNQALESVITSNATLPNPGINLLSIRVKADDGNWGTVYSKVIGLDISFNTQVVLSLPINIATNVPLTSSFVWEQLTGVGTYEYQCATDNTFTNIVQTGIITGLSVPFNSLQENTLYYWRVRANASGNVSLWSTVWSFTTDGNLNSPSFNTNNLISIIPNPTKNHIMIKSDIFSEYYYYMIYSNEGKKVLEGKIFSIENINIEKLSLGTYIIKCLSEDGLSSTSKFIKI